MTCATCGAVGAAGATWCAQCYLPYGRAGQTSPAVSGASGLPIRSAMPWQAPTGPALPPPVFAPPPVVVPPPTLALPPVFAGGPAPHGANPFAAPAGYPLAGYPPAGYPPAGYPPAGFGQQFSPPPDWPAKLGLVVPQIAVETGDLPRICVVSGQPTENMVKMRWSWAPSWTYLFLFLGVLPVLLVRHLAGTRAAGFLPIHPDVQRKRRLQGVAALLGLAGALVLLIGAAAMSSGVLAFLALALLVAGIACMVQPGRSLPVRPAGQGYLAFPKASPAFAAAFRAGRPVGQFPYSATPSAFRTGKAVLVLAVIAGMIVVPAGIYGFVHENNCRNASTHRNAPTVFAALNVSDRKANARIAGDAGQGMTDAEARQQLAEDRERIDQLNVVPLTAQDAAARDGYVTAVAGYDTAMDAALEGTGPDSAVDATSHTLVAAESRLRGQLTSLPTGCGTG